MRNCFVLKSVGARVRARCQVHQEVDRKAAYSTAQRHQVSIGCGLLFFFESRSMESAHFQGFGFF